MQEMSFHSWKSEGIVCQKESSFEEKTGGVEDGIVDHLDIIGHGGRGLNKSNRFGIFDLGWMQRGVGIERLSRLKTIKI